MTLCRPHEVRRRRLKSHRFAQPNICPCFYNHRDSSHYQLHTLHERTVCLCTGCLCGIGQERSHCDMSSEDLYQLPLNVYVIVLGIGLFIFMLSVIFCCYLFRCEHTHMWTRVRACSHKTVYTKAYKHVCKKVTSKRHLRYTHMLWLSSICQFNKRPTLLLCHHLISTSSDLPKHMNQQVLVIMVDH